MVVSRVQRRPVRTESELLCLIYISEITVDSDESLVLIILAQWKSMETTTKGLVDS